jgi:hypothetical protein
VTAAGSTRRGLAATDVRAELDRVEFALGRGEADLTALGFWRAVASIKADPALVELLADQAGRIDRAAFTSRVRPLFPVWLGNATLVGVLGVGAAAMVVASRADDPIVAGSGPIVAAVAWSIGVHGLAHWVSGSLVGIRFFAYFLGGPPPPRPGLKADYATYLRATPRGRAWMHASGAIATKLAPFAVLALAPRVRPPRWSAWIVGGIGVAQIITDIVFSRRSSDWKKFSREMRVAAAATA